MPHLTVTAGGDTFEAQKSSYCWDDTKRGIGQCADAAAPNMADVKVKPRLGSGDRIALAWSGETPAQVRIAVSFPGQERPDEAISWEGEDFPVAAGEGDQLYVVTATWDYGVVPYFFGVSAAGDEQTAALRKLAWESMLEGDRASVVGDWRQSEVTAFAHGDSVSLVRKGGFYEVKVADGRELVAVSFHTDTEGLLGPIVAVFDRESRELLGWLPRE